MRRTLAIVCLVLSGCGGGRSLAAEESTRILGAGQSDAAAECEAELLRESGLSDEGVMKISFGLGSNTAMQDAFDLDEIVADLSDRDRLAFARISEEFARCLR